jgi:hypothetical protein
LQPCDVGVNKPLKDGIRNQYNAWSVAKMDGLGSGDKIPVPEREDIIEWLVTSWQQVSSESIMKTFASIGYGVHPDSQSDEIIDNEPRDGEENNGNDVIELMEDLNLSRCVSLTI